MGAGTGPAPTYWGRRREERTRYTMIIRDALLLGVIFALAATEALAAKLPLWQPHDFEFQSETPHQNPFQVDFEAEAIGPDGKKMLIPGFFDGDHTWKIRFSPTSKGKWTIKTKSSDPKLDARIIGDIQAVANTNSHVHGCLRVDPSRPHHFVFEDGSRFFLMGYECDWLWALDSDDPKLPTANAFLDKISSYGFNYILLNVYAHDVAWRKGHTEPKDYGPPPMYAWEGTNEKPDHSRLNLPFWQHYDRIMDAMYQRGIVAHVMIKVYNKMVNWPEKLSPDDDLYFRTIIARYSAYPNVVWDFSKEGNKEPDLAYKLNRLHFIREKDPYKRLMTVHDDGGNYDRGVYNKVLDYRSDQQHGDWHKTILEQRKQNNWPIVNVEFGYEAGPRGGGSETYPECQPGEELARRAWEVYSAGGYGAYYYYSTAWDVIRPEETPPGYAYFKRLRDFFGKTNFWFLQPSDNLVSRGYCLADPGKEYVVVQIQPGEFELKIEEAKSALNAEWYEPLTGKRIPAGQLGNGMNKLSTPSSWKGMAALHVR